MASLKDASKYLSLSDAVTTLKQELLKADALATQAGDPLLLFKECEIELSLEFEPSAEIEFDAVIFKAKVGAKAKGGHKVKIKYEANRPLVAVMGSKGGSLK